MAESNLNLGQFATLGRQFARRMLSIWHNRLELLMVEVQEERERLLYALLLALGVAVFGLLAIMALSAAVVVLLWEHHPALVLLGLTALYGGTAGYLGWQLTQLLHRWQTLSASLDQLRKDRECLEKLFA